MKNNRTGKTSIYDYDDKTLRGSFINQFLLGVYVFLIFVGVLFSESIVNRMVKLSELMIAVFAISYGVWKAGSVIKYNKDADIASAKAERKEDYDKDKS